MTMATKRTAAATAAASAAAAARRGVPKPLKPPREHRRIVGSKGAAVQRRRDKFVQMYFVHGQNATKAAIAAGFSPKTAGSKANHLMREPEVAKQLEERAAQLLAKNELTAEEVINSLARAVRFDPRLLHNPDGSFKPILELPDDVALELEGMEFREIFIGGKGKGKGPTPAARMVVSKVVYPRKSVAREQAMRYFGLFAKDKSPQPLGDEEPATPISVTIDFKDARRKLPDGS